MKVGIAVVVAVPKVVGFYIDPRAVVTVVHLHHLLLVHRAMETSEEVCVPLHGRAFEASAHKHRRALLEADAQTGELRQRRTRGRFCDGL